jgi:hypothetical protein
MAGLDQRCGPDDAGTPAFPRLTGNQWENILAESGCENLRADILALIEAGLSGGEVDDHVEHFSLRMEVVSYNPEIKNLQGRVWK